VAPLLGAVAERLQKSRLADAGLALDGHARRAPVIELVERVLEPSQLRFAPDQRPGAPVRVHRAGEHNPRAGPVQGAGSGCPSDEPEGVRSDYRCMPVFLHEHRPHECEAAFGAWHGFKSLLRHRGVP